MALSPKALHECWARTGEDLICQDRLNLQTRNDAQAGTELRCQRCCIAWARSVAIRHFVICRAFETARVTRDEQAQQAGQVLGSVRQPQPQQQGRGGEGRADDMYVQREQQAGRQAGRHRRHTH